jgi:hypothetical protein
MGLPGEQINAGVNDTGDKNKVVNITVNFVKIQNGTKGILRGPVN